MIPCGTPVSGITCHVVYDDTIRQIYWLERLGVRLIYVGTVLSNAL